MSFSARLALVFSVFVITLSSQAQVATGQYPLGTFEPLGPDVINVGNLNVILNVPVMHKPGRAGTNFNYDLEYNSSIWTPGGTWAPDQNWGWLGQTATITGVRTQIQISGTCNAGSAGRQPYFQIQRVAYVDAAGIRHGWSGHIRDSDGLCTGDYDTLSNTWSQDGKYFLGSGGYPMNGCSRQRARYPRSTLCRPEFKARPCPDGAVDECARGKGPAECPGCGRSEQTCPNRVGCVVERERLSSISSTDGFIRGSHRFTAFQ